MALEKAFEMSKQSLHYSNVHHVFAEFYSHSHTFIEMWQHLTELGVVAAEAGDAIFARLGFLA